MVQRLVPSSGTGGGGIDEEERRRRRRENARFVEEGGAPGSIPFPAEGVPTAEPPPVAPPVQTFGQEATIVGAGHRPPSPAGFGFDPGPIPEILRGEIREIRVPGRLLERETSGVFGESIERFVRPGQETIGQEALGGEPGLIQGTDVTIDELERAAGSLFPVLASGLTVEGDTIASLLNRLAAEDPSSIVDAIVERGRSPQSETLLVTLFENITRANVGQLFGDPSPGEEELDRLVDLAFPGMTAVQLDGLEDEQLLRALRTGGRTDAKSRVLEEMGVSPEARRDLLRLQDVVVPLDGVRKLVTQEVETGRIFDQDGRQIGSYNPVTLEVSELPVESMMKDHWDAVVLNSIGAWDNIKGSFFLLMPNLMFPDPFDLEDPSKATPGRREELIQMSERNRKLRDEFRVKGNESRREFQVLVDKHPEWQPRTKEWAEGILQHPRLAFDRNYWIYEFASIVPYLVASVGAAGITAALTKSPALAAVAGGAVMVPVESGAIVGELIDNGVNEKQAAEIALVAGVIIGAMEGLGKIPLFKRLSPLLFRKARDEIVRETIRLTLAKLAKRGIKDYSSVVFIEVFTETLQEGVSNGASRIFDENQSLFEGLPDIAAKTFVATTPLGLAGVAAGAHTSFRRAPVTETRGSPDAVLERMGLVKEPKTGDWYRPVDLGTESVADLPHAEGFAPVEEVAVAVPAEGEVIPLEAPAEAVEAVEPAVAPEVAEPEVAPEITAEQEARAALEVAEGIRRITREPDLMIEADEVVKAAQRDVDAAVAAREAAPAVVAEEGSLFRADLNILEATKAGERVDFSVIRDEGLDVARQRLNTLKDGDWVEDVNGRRRLLKVFTTKKGEVRKEFQAFDAEGNLIDIIDAESNKGLNLVARSKNAEAPEVAPEAAPAVSEAPVLAKAIETTRTKLRELKKPNSAVGERQLTNLQDQGVDVSEAREALAEYTDTVRSDFDSQEEFSETRAEKWDEFLDAVDNIEIPVVPPTPAVTPKPPRKPAPKAKSKPVEKPPVVPGKPPAKKKRTTVPVPQSQEIVPPPPSTTEITPEQTTAVLNLFSNALLRPETARKREATLEWRKLVRSQRVTNMQSRIEELIVEGIRKEEAIKQAERETMVGALPDISTDEFQDLTTGMRDALFGRVYEVLKDEPFELMSTSDALTNALQGRTIPREPGTTGRSAHSRLLRVFANEPEIMEMLDQGKTLEDSIKSVFAEEGGDPVQLDQEWLDYARSLPPVPLAKEGFAEWQGLLLGSTDPTVQEIGRTYEERRQGLWNEVFTPQSIEDTRSQLEKEFSATKLRLGIALDEGEITQATHDVEMAIARETLAAYPPVTRYEAPINSQVNQPSMMPIKDRILLVRALKEVGQNVLDIGNFMRANLASFDFSFWRQQAPLIMNNIPQFITANKEAWNAIFSQKSAEASWQRITKDPLFDLYDKAGYDFLRPLELPKGTSQWKGTEEFGFLGSDRPIPKFTEKIPWVKISQRAFVTGTNIHNWETFHKYYDAMLKVNEKMAAGEIKLKPGEGFSVEANMKDFAQMLGDMTGRAQLGRAAELAPAANALFFSMRLNLGRLLTPRHLVSANKFVRAEAWKNLTTFIGTIGGILLLGDQQDWWDVERDPRSSDFMKVRIGNTRIDPWGGFQQFVVFFSRIITQTGLVSATGKEYPAEPIRTTTNFIRTKASPLASVITEFVTGKTFFGDKLDIKNPKQWIDRLAPFAISDVWEAWQDTPIVGGLVALPAILGAGTQTYSGDWEENITKLGEPKYSDNLPYSIEDPVYDGKDFWSDHAGEFKGVDPEELTPKKGFAPIIKGLAEAQAIREETADITKTKLVSVNADPSKGDTFVQFHEQWKERQKITDEEKLKAFDADERTRNAHLGDFTTREFQLLKKYHGMSKARQAKWVEENPEDAAEIFRNPWTEWLKANPEENAALAVFGQAKVQTLEAYDKAKALAKKWGMPVDSIGYLPPRKIVESNFEYQDAEEEFSPNSAETRLILAKDDDYRKWRKDQFGGFDPVETPIAALELQVNSRELNDQEDLLRETLPDISDKDDPKYKTGRQFAIDKLKDDNPLWVDDQRRIEAIKKGTNDAPVPQERVEGRVEYGRQVDSDGSGSSETRVWLVDHIDDYRWALDNDLLTDDGGLPKDERSGKHDAWNIRRLEAIVRSRDVDALYELVDKDDKEAVNRFKDAHKPWVSDQRRIEAYGWEEDISDKLVESHVAHGKLVDEFSANSAEVHLARFDDKTGYEKFRTDTANIDKDFFLKPVDSSKVPIWRIDVEYRADDRAYGNLTTDADREAYLFDRRGKPTIYAKKRRERDAYENNLSPDNPEALKSAAREFMDIVRPPSDLTYKIPFEGKILVFKGKDLHEIYADLGIDVEWNRTWSNNYKKMASALDAIIQGRAPQRQLVEALDIIQHDIFLDTGARNTAIADGNMELMQFYDKVLAGFREVEQIYITALTPGLFDKYVEYYTKTRKGMAQELYLKENQDLALYLALPVSGKSIESLQLSVDWQDQTDEYDGFSTFGEPNYIKDPDVRDDARHKFLYVTNRDYGRARREIEGWDRGVPKGMIQRYADYYMIIGDGKPEGSTIWFVDDRYLQEHPAYYENVYLGILHRDPKDFSKIPNERFEQFYNERYPQLDRKARYALRGGNSWFDTEGARIGFWKPWKRLGGGGTGLGARLI